MAKATGSKKRKTAKTGRDPRPHGRGWHFLGNLLLLLGIWVTGVLFIQLGGPKRYAGLAEGQRAPATVVASVDFECENLGATELLRQQAGDRVVPVFTIQTGPLQTAIRSLGKLADRAVAVRDMVAASDLPDRPAAEEPPAAEDGNEEGDADEAAAEAVAAAPRRDPPGPLRPLEAELTVAADLLGVSVSGAELARLFAPGQENEALDVLVASFEAVWMGGILSEADRKNGFEGHSQSSTIDILLAPGEDEAPVYRTVRPRDLPSVKMAADRVTDLAQAGLAELDIEVGDSVLEELVRPVLRPNLSYDIPATRARREAVRRDVEPVSMTVRAGTTLMEERTTVTAQTVVMINAYNRRMAELETPRDRWMERGGDAALILMVLVVCAVWLNCTEPGIFGAARRKWLLVLLGVTAIAIESLYHYLSVGLNLIPPWLVPFAIPVTLTTVLAALMLSPEAALAMALWSSLSAALIFDRSFELLLLGLAGSVLAVVLLRKVRKRSQVMRAGLAAGLLKALLALALAAMVQHQPSTFLVQMGAGVLSGCLAALLALLLLPLLEWLFQHTTDISLLELTDMSHPLLQRLALEAPGTYHHSLMVGAIGQAAANRIGANGLLVSVCASFHDIGKLPKPEFFTENQRGGENPHDSLAPSMSALVIQSHVKEGLTLAKRYKLPRPVCEGITAHHGTTLTSYFYQLAKRSLQESGMAEDSGLEHTFRYEGPKPHTREMAILMLADTIEAASRSLEKPTPNRIAEMVEKLMREKLLDGQLDHCPLTLRELHEIRDSFVFSLSNMLHGRSAYPSEDTAAQPAAGADGAAGGAAPAGAGAGKPGVPG